MLPFISMFNGQSRIAYFDQATDFLKYVFPFNQNGVCAGISFDWIRQHVMGEMATFVSNIGTPYRVRYIQDFQVIYNGGYSQICVEGFAQLTGLKIQSTEALGQLMCSRHLAEAMTEHKGYIFINFGNMTDPIFPATSNTNHVSHVVALYNDDTGYEFFDPNFGSAFFPTRSDFISWYELFTQYFIFKRFNSMYPKDDIVYNSKIFYQLVKR